MPCLTCGENCSCSGIEQAVVRPRWLPDAETAVATVLPEIEKPAIETPATKTPATKTPATKTPVQTWEVQPNSQGPATEDSAAWRRELAARLNRYQSRRKPRPPRYPSLRLGFGDTDSFYAVNSSSADSVAFPQTTHALALKELALRTDDSPESTATATAMPQANASLAAFPSFSPADPRQNEAPSTALNAAPTTAKIIEFPRFWTPAPSPIDELAEPVMGRPRILEAPEVVPPPPALGGITIEPVQQSEMERRPGIDIPLQSAPLGRRILSAAIDDAIVAVASLLFGFIFWKMTALQPPRLQIIGIAIGVPGAFWAAYQYLLLVYSGKTPGLHLAHLELARFDGSLTGRRLRRWRVLASFLSAASLGMGYAWVFLDEDALCWHDRITHTYLAPRK